DCRASTFVDCACGGSHDCASFFSEPVSLPASKPPTARIRIQKTRTIHLPRRPLGKPTIARALLIFVLLRSAALSPLRRTPGTPDRHGAEPSRLRRAGTGGTRPSLVTQTSHGLGTHRCATS